MSFPNNWWTFVQQYQFSDKDEVYTNGSMLIPSFRVRQMVEHYFGGEVGKTSRYAELFGTPERAAKTAWRLLMCSITTGCNECPMREGCEISTDIDCDDGEAALLEWLRGES